MLLLACTVAVLGVLFHFANVPLYLLVSMVTLYYTFMNWKWLLLVRRTFRRDIKGIYSMLRIMYVLFKNSKKKLFFKHALAKHAKQRPNKLAFVSADTNKSLTFKEADELANKIGNVFYEAGYRKGDVVALMMENRIEYMPIFTGLSSIGVTTSLINYNCRGDSLKHCLAVSNSKSIIFSEEMTASLNEIKDDVELDLYCFDSQRQCGRDDSSPAGLGTLLNGASSVQPPAPQDLEVHQDTSIYIYTSGTTGLPKAVVTKIFRHITLVTVFSGFFKFRDDDVFYESLPLYHASGMFMTCTAFTCGITTVIKKKFSASRYMEDCCKYNVTAINYIGETCRYILAQPKRVYDETNKIRIACGNGLRASIWKEFQNRYNISTITEFYGASEGNTALFANNTGRVGAVGYLPNLIPNRNFVLVRVHPETGDIIRDADGIAIRAQPGEPGQAVGMINKVCKFEGYTDKAATKKKIGHDIVKKGDTAFLSGDILISDEEGFCYFRDRTGDTFRWKGENVSTNEVEGLISKVLLLTDVCVYGIELPGMEGKAGMACIHDPERTTKVDGLHAAFDQVLPKYAQPVFLRLSDTVDVTGTFKFQKTKLRKEGFDPHACAEDALYYFDIKEKNYLPLDSEIYQQILDGNVRF